MQERNTKQKQVILEAARTLDHPSATEVYRFVREAHPGISRGTVFRVLRGYANRGVLQSVRVDGNDEIFDKTVTPHYHVRCVECGIVRDSAFPVSEALKSHHADGEFSVTEHDVCFFGLCAGCRAKRERI